MLLYEYHTVLYLPRTGFTQPSLTNPYWVQQQQRSIDPLAHVVEIRELASERPYVSTGCEPECSFMHV